METSKQKSGALTAGVILGIISNSILIGFLVFILFCLY